MSAYFDRPRPLGAVPNPDDDLSWQARATCKRQGHDPDRWFSDSIKDKVDASTVCKTDCPVVNECLSLAIRTREPYGIWGGQQFAGGRVVPLRGRGRPPKVRQPQDA